MSESAESPCVVALNPVVKAGTTIGSCQYVTPEEPELVQRCIAIGPTYVPPFALAALDKKVLCQVFCCCLKSPNVGAADARNLRQSCVADTLNGVDKDLGFKSRYKAEISYAMRGAAGGPKPPYPFMHRDGSGDTTQPSDYWQGRTKEIPGYRSGKGDVRRPDVVIVRDPTKPPETGNIVRVIEMKFPGDPVDEEQLDAYRRIAGGRNQVDVYTEKECECKDDRKPREEFEWDKLIEILLLLLMLLIMKGVIEDMPEGPLPGPYPAPGIA